MHILKKVSVLVSLAIMLTVNALAVLLPINDKTTEELSDAIAIYFVPEGCVFSIWSLIYVALTGYAIYQLMKKNADNTRLHSIAWLFVINGFANAGWILLWHYEYVATSVLLMLTILATLLFIYIKLGIGKESVTRAQYWFTHFPFSLYLGWISVATIANIAGALHVHEWGAWGIAPQNWSAIMIGVAALLAMTMVLRRKDFIFAGVVIWAVIGIALKFSDVTVILWTSIAAIGLILLVAAAKAMKLMKK
jgi:hypothetical protein